MYVCILPVITLVIAGIILIVRENFIETYGFNEKWSIDYWIFILNIIRTIH